METLHELLQIMLSCNKLDKETAHYTGDDIIKELITYFREKYASQEEKEIIEKILQERERQMGDWWWA